MSATLRAKVAGHAMDGTMRLGQTVTPLAWSEAMDAARRLSVARQSRVLAVVTPGLLSPITWLDLYVEPQP